MSEFHLPHDHHHEKHHEDALARLAIIDDFNLTAEVFKINISAMVNMSSPAVSHHLKQLKAGGLITSRRDGKEMFYKASDTERSRLLHCMIERLMGIVCPED